ncbi:MAG: AbrB/MazE/SpoVT family DNA-binding domain-containing protein [Candidatus Hydrothermarchaeota archaeon]
MPVVTRKYQVTIPKKIRELLNISIGDEIEFIPTSKGVLLKPGKKVPGSLEKLAELALELDILEAEKEVREGIEKSIKVD